MEGLTFSTGPQGNPTELRNAKQAASTNRPTETPADDAAASTSQATEERREQAEVKRAEVRESPFQTRLHYDKDKAALFVEVLDRATGDVIQRIPAETAAERIHELTGSQGGAVVDKIA